MPDWEPASPISSYSGLVEVSLMIPKASPKPPGRLRTSCSQGLPVACSPPARGEGRGVEISLTCSFCGKSQDQCTFMAQGPNEVTICNGCVELIVEEMTEEKEKRALET